ncbi:MAG: TRAP transporter small permease subunit [Bradyrhizobiaceae bacterium]|nr:TRAP transporter small permease subunit [Bradyrhizobiaceae bacterium]
MRVFLDRFYGLALYLAAACLVLIAALVGAQVLGRTYDVLLMLFGNRPYGFLVPSLAELAGYLLAAASFLALAGTLKRGAHIRVTVLLSSVSERARYFFELWALAAGAVFVAYACWHLALFSSDSLRFKEVSYGIIPMPLWIPQAVMAFGVLALLIALIDEFFITLRRGRPSFRTGEDIVSGAKEG